MRTVCYVDFLADIVRYILLSVQNTRIDFTPQLFCKSVVHFSASGTVLYRLCTYVYTCIRAAVVISTCYDMCVRTYV